jgi:hypothetical protein
MARYVEFPCPICYEETDFAEGQICSTCVADKEKGFIGGDNENLA